MFLTRRSGITIIEGNKLGFMVTKPQSKPTEGRTLLYLTNHPNITSDREDMSYKRGRHRVLVFFFPLLHSPFLLFVHITHAVPCPALVYLTQLGDRCLSRKHFCSFLWLHRISIQGGSWFISPVLCGWIFTLFPVFCYNQCCSKKPYTSIVCSCEYVCRTGCRIGTHWGSLMTSSNCLCRACTHLCSLTGRRGFIPPQPLQVITRFDPYNLKCENDILV